VARRTAVREVGMLHGGLRANTLIWPADEQFLQQVATLGVQPRHQLAPRGDGRKGCRVKYVGKSESKQKVNVGLHTWKRHVVR